MKGDSREPHLYHSKLSGGELNLLQKSSSGNICFCPCGELFLGSRVESRALMVILRGCFNVDMSMIHSSSSHSIRMCFQRRFLWVRQALCEQDVASTKM